MRRSLVTLLTLCVTVAARLAAQSVASIGFASTLGGEWQIEAVEFGLMHRTALGPLQAVGGALRAGWFGDQSAILGGTRGFVGAAALAARSGRLVVADVGQDANPTSIGLDVTLEVAGYVGSNAPPLAQWPERNRWMSVAVLPGLWVGQSSGSRFGIMVGPAWFAGRVRRTHAFLGVRIEVPLARGRGGP